MFNPNQPASLQPVVNEKFTLLVTAIRAIAPDTVFHFDTNYLRLVFCRPDETLARYALSDMLTKLAHAHGVVFDGYDEEGWPCFLTEVL